MSGNDAPVRDYVMNSQTARTFLDKLTDMVQFLIPNYVAEGKNRSSLPLDAQAASTGRLRWPMHCITHWNRKRDMA